MSANSRLTTAVHALCWIELAHRQGREPLTSAEVASSLASHPVLIRRTLAPLRDRGLLVSGRGPGAGWRLARLATQITVAEIRDALDRGPLFELHPHQPNQQCPVGAGIRPVLDQVYAQADDAVTASLNRHTVAELLDTILASR